jgi:cation/acetate symporter
VILMPDSNYFNVRAGGQFNKVTDLIGGRTWQRSTLRMR